MTIDDLDYCESYWVVVTAIDCVHHVSSSPELVGLFQPLRFNFMMSVDDSTLCTSWITNNLIMKITEVEKYLISDSSCGMFISCVAKSHFSCGTIPSVITFE